MKHRIFSVLAISALFGASSAWALEALRSQTNNLLNQERSLLVQFSSHTGVPSGNNTPGQLNNSSVTDGYSFSQNTDGTVSVVAIAGTITLDLGNGKTVAIDPGKGTIVDPKTNQPVKDAAGNEVRSLKAMLDSASPTDRQALVKGLTDSVQRHAQQVVNNTNSAQTNQLVTETAFMMKTLAAALDSNTMSTIMQGAVATLTQATTLTGVATNTAISALIEGAKQGGASETAMIASANTGAQASGKSFSQTDLQQAVVVNQVLTTNPVNVDLVISPSS